MFFRWFRRNHSEWTRWSTRDVFRFGDERIQRRRERRILVRFGANLPRLQKNLFHAPLSFDDFRLSPRYCNRSIKLFLQFRGRSLYAWIHFNQQWLRVTLARHRHPYRVRSRQRSHSPRRDNKFIAGEMSAPWNFRVMQVPNPAVHSGSSRHWLGRGPPKCRELEGFGFHRRGFVVARISAHDFALPIDYLNN